MDEITNATAQQLKAFIERVERLEEDKKNISDDITGVYAEAKGNGFDPKIPRKIVAIRKMNEDEAQGDRSSNDSSDA